MHIKENPEITAKWTEKANPGQAEAIGHINGAAVLVAGAGAGKTFTILNRAANLIEHGVPPRHVLVVTFTNQAANEIKERMGRLLGERGEDVITGTFHSVALRHILKRYCESDNEFMERHKLRPDFTIIDQDEAKKSFKRAMEACGDRFSARMEELEIPLRDMTQRIGLWRSHGHSDPDLVLKKLRDVTQKKQKALEMSSLSEQDKMERGVKLQERFIRQEMTVDLWKAYREIIRNDLNAIDFDEILNLTADLLKQNDDVLRAVADEFRYLMIDEFQDTNNAQMEIVKAISKYVKNFVFVGDPRQSIYGFRGADVTLIENLDKIFSDIRRIDMLYNYRSQSRVLEAMNHCAASMKSDMCKKGLVAANEDVNKTSRSKPGLVTCLNQKDEAAFVADYIKDKRAQSPDEEIAVLYRSRAHKEAVEQKLMEENIPFTIIGDTSFFERSEIKDALGMARFLLYPNDSPAGLRFLSATNRLGISEDSVREKIQLSGGRLTPFSYLESIAEGAMHTRHVIDGEVKKVKNGGKRAERAKALMDAVQYMHEAHSGRVHPEALFDDLKAIWNLYLRDKLKTKSLRENDDGGANFEMRENNVIILLDRIKNEMLAGKSLDMIFEDLSLLVDNSVGMQQAHEDNPVKLMTIHASKGLEFDTVIAICNDHGEGEEARIGVGRSVQRAIQKMSPEEREDYLKKSESEREEERRIFYTCGTRAKRDLVFTASENRQVIRDGGVMFEKRRPSLYINEVKKALNEKTYAEYKSEKKREQEYNSFGLTA